MRQSLYGPGSYYLEIVPIRFGAASPPKPFYSRGAGLSKSYASSKISRFVERKSGQLAVSRGILTFGLRQIIQIRAGESKSRFGSYLGLKKRYSTAVPL